MWKDRKLLLCIFLTFCFTSSCSKNTADSEPVFRVVEVSPANGKSQVGLNDSIFITFSLQPDTSSIEINTVILNDSIEGDITINNNTIVFAPSVSLDSNTVYFSTVSKTLLSMDGLSLSRDFSWSFTTVDGGAFNWYESTDTAGYHMKEVVWGKDKFVMVGTYGVSPYEAAIYISSDGISWNEIQVNEIPMLNGIAYYKDRFIAVGEFGTIIRSSDGVRWEKINTPFNMYLFDVASSNNLLVAIGTGKVFTSVDAATWEEIVVPFSGQLYSICWTGSQFVVTTQGDSMSHFLLSTDGEIWNKISIERAPSSRKQFYGIGASKDMIIAVGPDEDLFTSTDGTIWTEQELGIPNSEWIFLQSVIWDGQRFVVVGGSHLAIGGFSAISEDGINWSHYKYVFENGGGFTSIAWSGSKYVVASRRMSGRIFYSPKNLPNK